MNSKTPDTQHLTPGILIVEDDLNIGEFMHDLLTSEGYYVDCAVNGRHALEMMSQKAYELIISDIIMDEMDGIEFLKQVKEKDPDIPFLVMTGHGSMESAIRALKLGAFDYMKKPVDNNEILITIENALEVVRLRKEKDVLFKKITEYNENLARKVRERTEHILRTKNELKQTEKKYRSLVENSPDIIYILDSDGCLSFVSGAVESLTGFTKEELIGKHFTSIIWPEDITKAEFRFNERRTGERSTKGFETRLRIMGRKKGDFEINCLPIELHAFGIYDEPTSAKDKRYQGTYGVVRDISDRKRVEDALRKSEAGLVAAQRIACLGNWDWDIVNNKLLWSDEIYRIFGVSPQEFENNYEAFLDSVHPDDRQFVKKSVDQALNKKKPYKINHRIIQPTGEERIVHEQAEIEFDASGRAIRMIGTVQDITEFKRVEEKLLKSQAMLQTVFDGISEPMVFLGPEMEIQMLNDAARKYYRLLESKDYDGAYCFTACNGLKKPCNGCDIPMIIKKREMRTIERDGLMDSSKIEEVTIFPLFKSGQINGSLIRISDITEKKKTQEQLIRADRLSSLGQLSAGIAHEIRNPLSSIKLFTDILGDTERFPRKAEEMAIIDDLRDNANKIDGIVNRVLDFAKPSIKTRNKISINVLIKEEIELWSSKIRQSKIDVNLSLQKDIPPILVDSIELRQVINNMVMNAVDAMEKGGALSISTSGITSSFYKDRHVVLLKVKDTGSGIHPGDKKKIFDPFFTTKSYGTGLGLSISYQIIKQHGGIISCESEPGKGTTFTIEIPCLSEE